MTSILEFCSSSERLCFRERLPSAKGVKEG